MSKNVPTHWIHKIGPTLIYLSIYDFTDGLMKIVVQPQKDEPRCNEKIMFCWLTRLCWAQWIAMSPWALKWMGD